MKIIEKYRGPCSRRWRGAMLENTGRGDHSKCENLSDGNYNAATEVEAKNLRFKLAVLGASANDKTRGPGGGAKTPSAIHHRRHRHRRRLRHIAVWSRHCKGRRRPAGLG